MNEMDLLRAIGGVREEYIEEAAPMKKSRPVRRWLAAVACLAALLALTMTALALTDAGELLRQRICGEVKVKGYTTENPAPGCIESIYELEIGIDTIPEAQITGDVIEEGVATILWQYQNYKLWDSWLPSHAQKQFGTEAEAVEYVGYGPLKLSNLGWELKYVHVDALASLDIDYLSQIGIECFYKHDGMNIQTFATLYTDHYDGEQELRSIVQGKVEFSQSTYMSQRGTPCLIMGTGENGNGFLTRTAYLVVENVLYRFHIAYQPEQEEAAQTLMYQWLDQY